MDIYYQWIPGSYSYIVSLQAKKGLKHIDNVIGVEHFEEVRKQIENWAIGVLPIENSYAGSIQTNIHNFLRYDFTIIGELVLPIRHCLLGNTSDIQTIKQVYSHPQALAQCYQFLQKYNIEWVARWDTASAVRHIAKSKDKHIAAIASQDCSKLYATILIKKWIEDQNGNSTRFVMVSKSGSQKYSHSSDKMSIIFETKHMAWALHKCLWCFATNHINLTKIESLPSHKDPFHYLFRIDFHGNPSLIKVKETLEELRSYAYNIKVIGAY